jgi:hypothetical protein
MNREPTTLLNFPSEIAELKLVITIFLFYYLLCFLFNKIEEQEEQVLPRSGGRRGGRKG